MEPYQIHVIIDILLKQMYHLHDSYFFQNVQTNIQVIKYIIKHLSHEKYYFRVITLNFSTNVTN